MGKSSSMDLHASLGRFGFLEGAGLTVTGFAVLFGAILLVKFGPVLVGWRTFFFGDFGFFGYPLAVFHREAFWAGALPFWNPYSSCGIPFLAQWNTLTLYPGSLLYLLLPLPWSLNLFVLAHLWLGALGMYSLAWRLSSSRGGATLAGLAYGLSGLLQYALIWPNNIAALGWMPWVVLSFMRAVGTGGRWIGIAVVIGSLQMLTGAPEVILLTWVCAVALGCVAAGSGRLPNGLEAGRGAVVIVGVGLLCSMQLLPFFGLLSSSDRSSGEFSSAQWALPTGGWLNLLVPLANMTSDGNAPYFQRDQEWTSSYYVGIGSVVLAITALASRGRAWRISVVLLGLAVLGVVLAIGPDAGLFSLVQLDVSPFKIIRYPVKFVVLTVCVVPLLAALGLRWMEQTAQGRPRLLWVAVGVGVVALLATGGGVGRFADHYDARVTWSSLVTRLVLLAGMAAAACIALGSAQSSRRGLVGWWTVTTLFLLDLLTFAPRLAPTASPWLLAPFVAEAKTLDPLPAVGVARARTSNDAMRRVFLKDAEDRRDDYLLKRSGLLLNSHLIDRVPTLHGFYSLYPRRASEATRAVAALADPDAHPVLDFLSVSQVTREGAYEWKRRSGSMPWLTGGQAPRCVEEDVTLRHLADKTFDPRREVLLGAELRDRLEGVRFGAVRVGDVRWRHGALEADVQVPERGLLVLSQVFDRGWRAWADGVRVDVWRANHAFQAVDVPAGATHVRMAYRPVWFELAAALTCLGLLAGRIRL
jgi:hypothetical protein